MEEVKENIYLHNLDQATTLFVVPQPQAQTITLRFVFTSGSVDEPQGQEGITNLVQRLSRKQTRSYTSQYKLMRALEEHGVTLATATYRERHVYKLGLTNLAALAGALKILAEVIWWPRFDARLLEEEKELAYQDWLGVRDNPSQWALVIALRKLWRGTAYAHLPLGDPAALKRLSVDDLHEQHRRIRSVGHLYIGLAGRVSPNQVVGLLEPILALRPRPKQPYGSKGVRAAKLWQRRLPLSELRRSAKGASFALEQRNLQQANLRIVFSVGGETSSEYNQIDLLSWVMGKGFLSRLFNAIRTESSLAYDYHAAYWPYQKIGAFIIAGGVPAARLGLVFAKTWQQIRDIQQGGLKEWEVKRGFNYYTGNKSRQLEQSDALLSFVMGRYISHGCVLTFNEWKEQLGQVRLSDLTGVARDVFRPERAKVGLVGPVKLTRLKKAWQEGL